MRFPRWARPTEEELIQAAIVEYLTFAAPETDTSSPIWFHVPNQRVKKSKRIILKLLGVRAGVADLCIVWQGLVMFIEVKTPTGRPSKSQRVFRDHCEAQNIPYRIVRSVDDFLEAYSEFLAMDRPASDLGIG